MGQGGGLENLSNKLGGLLAREKRGRFGPFHRLCGCRLGPSVFVGSAWGPPPPPPH